MIDRKMYHVTMVKQVTVAVMARTPAHAVEIVVDQDSDHMYEAQWLWAKPTIFDVGDSQ